MKKESNKAMSVLAVLLVISVVLNVVFFFFLQRSEWTKSSDDTTGLQDIIDQQKIEIESLKLQLEQAQESGMESESMSENSSESDMGVPPVTADNKNNSAEPSSSTGENVTGYTEAAKSFLDALFTYNSDDMDNRNERLRAVISGSEITAKLITSGAASDTETDGVSDSTSWQTEYSSELEDSQIYVSDGSNTASLKALADVTYTLTDELGTMTVSAIVSIEMEQNGQGDYKVTGCEIMSRN